MRAAVSTIVAPLGRRIIIMFRNLAFALLSCSLAIASTIVPRPASAQFEQLAAKIPSTANAIVLLDAQRIMASPIAQQEGWKERYEQAFASGLVSISPDTRRMVLGVAIDYQTM